jgi:beta-lactamase superfamily II metal-dependent hydrolase
MGGALVRAAEPTWALALARLIRRRAVVMAVLAAGSAVLVLMFAVYRGYPNGRLHIWFLDMGRSNAALIQTPRGAHLLVDGGRFPSRLLTALGDRLPFNKQTLDAVIITQPDENDIGGLAAMVGRYQVGVLLTNRQPTLSRTYETLRTSLGDQRIVTVRAGYTLDADDGTRLEILHPQRLPRLRDSTDDQALVLRLSYGDVSFLLPGDLSRRGQQTLLRRGWPLGSTVLQLPRHAAANSLEETFLKAIAPQVAVLQADADAPYSQPHPDTLKLLGDTPLFRTDVGGTIHLWTDGKELWMGREG